VILIFYVISKKTMDLLSQNTHTRLRTPVSGSTV